MVLKRGASYFTIGTSRLQFHDVLSFSSPCSLSKYLKMWGVSENKSIFPYQHFRTVEEVVATTNFPGHLAFYSSLKDTNVDPEIYAETRKYFEFCKKLPASDPRHMRNMGCFLRRCNLIDCRPLVEAITTSFAAFHRYFGLDPLQSLSLPSIAMKACLRLYDQDCAYIYSFPGIFDDIRAAHRANVVGGAVAVYHRFVYNFILISAFEQL